MPQTNLGLLSLTIISLFLAGQAQAFSCLIPVGSNYLGIENPPSKEKMLRLNSLEFARRFANTRRHGDVIVVGRFHRNVSQPFLHEEQIEDIRAKYWPPAENVQMPNSIEYSYLGAFSFESHTLVDATLVPFSTDAIDVHVSVIEEYEGAVELLPATETDVIGVLRSGRGGTRLELTTSLCPSYDPIEPVQMIDLLNCYRDGVCQ